MRSLLLFFLLLASDHSHAIDVPCTKSLAEEVEAAEVIVLAYIEEDSLNSEGIGGIKFRVKTQWKGEVQEHLNILANARFPFSKSKSGLYLIYANQINNEDKSYWRIPWCKQIQHVENSDSDIRFLKESEFNNEDKNI